MKVFSIGTGFVSDHLKYQKIDSRLDFSSKQIENLLDTHKPDVLINCIGKTGRPNVDWCENNKEDTANANVALPILMAEACAKRSIHLIQIGSGCIYFGKSPNRVYVSGNGATANKIPVALSHTTALPTAWPTMLTADTPTIEDMGIDTGWKETDFANPQSFYSKTKYACDLAIGSMKHVTTLRIRMPISYKNQPRNLINKLRGYKQVIDIPNSMTFMEDLATCIDWVIDRGQVGIFHVTNPQPVTAAEIMKEFQKYVPDHKFEIINEKQLDDLTLAKRSNCILNGDKLREAGFYMTPSKEALSKCMEKYVKNI